MPLHILSHLSRRESEYLGNGHIIDESNSQKQTTKHGEDTTPR